MAESKKYKERFQAVLAAIEIAETVTENVHPPRNYSQFRKTLFNASPKMRNLKSLAYLETAVFTEFNEGSGAYVEEFWLKVKEAGLPFERRDLLMKVLQRGRIVNDVEYELLVDRLIVRDGELQVEFAQSESKQADLKKVLEIIRKWEKVDR